MINLKTFEYVTATVFCFLGAVIALVTSLNSVEYSDGQSTGIGLTVILLEVLAFVFYSESEARRNHEK